MEDPNHIPPPSLESRKKGRRRVKGTIPSFSDLARLTDPIADDDDPFPLPPDIEEIPPEEPGESDLLTSTEREELRNIIEELSRRESEALQLYEPMPEQERFHSCHAPERIIRGGNRGGKTLAACVELARAITGQDPHHKYSPTSGRAIAVGLDLLHCSKVIYRKLFLPGAFQVITDPITGMLRAFRPENEWDGKNAHLAKPAPPLIPQRFYKPTTMSWDNKKEEILKSVKFTTGWELTFFSSLGPPPQGWDADIVIFDEEIIHHRWYPEVSARLMDRRRWNPDLNIVQNGKFWWSATPQAGTQKLYDLSSKAAEQKDDPSARIVEFFVNLLGNVHITQEAKDEFISKMEGNEDEYRIRVLGDFALLGMRVYPEFAPRGVHGCPSFIIPDTWTRYAFIDPGTQRCAVLFVAIPPPSSEYAGRKVIYDELYIKRASAAIFAQQLKEKVGNFEIYEGVIDHHAGRITEIGSGRTVEEQYSDALRKVNFTFRRTKHSFSWASDDVRAGIEAVRRGLHIVDGKSEWLVFNDKCKWLIWEAERYSYKKIATQDVVTDDPVKMNDHLMDDWRYAAMHNMRYVRPIQKKRQVGYTNRAIKAKKERAQAKKAAESGWGDSVILG